jgi:hypothetical protein
VLKKVEVHFWPDDCLDGIRIYDKNENKVLEVGSFNYEEI